MSDEIVQFLSSKQVADFVAFIRSPAVAIVSLVILVVSTWRIFTKAGKPGWGALIPIYNLYLLCKVGGKPGYWIVFLFMPFINILFALLVAIGIAGSFDRGRGFGLGLFFLPVLFCPILAFGSSTYYGDRTGY